MARGIGMALVFYGHFAEKLVGSGSEAALSHWKAIYAFHMPLFFFLAGVFWKPRRDRWRPWMLGKVRTRLLPVFSFSLLLLPLFMERLARGEWTSFLKSYLQGQPLLNWPTWFLVCLLMVEAWAALFATLVPLQRRRSAWIGLGVASLLGAALVEVMSGIDPDTRKPLAFWFLLEGLVALPFYLLGLVYRATALGPIDVRRDGLVLAASAAFVLATFDRSTDLRTEPVVVMAVLNHGHWYWFYPTAVAGIACVVHGSRLIGRFVPPLAEVGRRSLMYLGVAGIGFAWLEAAIIGRVGSIPSSGIQVALYCMLYVCGSLLLWFPLVYAFERWVPKAFGLRPRDRA